MIQEPRPHEVAEIEAELDCLFDRLLEIDPDALLRIHLAAIRAARQPPQAPAQPFDREPALLAR